MMNIFTSSRAPHKPITSHLSNSAFQTNTYIIPRASTKTLRSNKNLDSFKDGAPVRVIDRFGVTRSSISDNTRMDLTKKVTKQEVSPENELEDIEEHDGNKENYSINRIPISPIAFKQMPTSLSRLNTSTEKRLDSCHMSTEPSVGNTSIHTTPSQDPKRLSYFGEQLDQITNDLKPPSSVNEYQKQRLSTNSLTELDEKETPRRSKLIFYSASKDRKNPLTTQMPSHQQETHSNSNFHGPIRAESGRGSLHLENKNMDQSTEISQIIKHTPSKSNTGSAEKPQRGSVGSNDKNSMCYSLNHSHSKTRHSCHKQSRSTAEKISYTSENLKKYLSNFNKLEHFDPKNWIKQVLTTNPRKKLQCSCDANLSTNESCSRALAWLYKRFKPEEFGYLKSTYEKIVAENRLAEPEQIKQIQKDIPRTYPSCKLFEAESEGAKTLERVLNAFAKYDPVVGYVQGMNFIAGSLLYHTEEYLAFWLLVSIFETLEMRDIYLPRLPGLSKHCQIIDMLMFNVLPDVYAKLCEFQIKAEIFCSEWILTLFGSVVPIEDMGLIYDHLLADGWPFFYKLILAFLSHFSKEIQEQTDIIEVLTILKSQNHLPKNASKTKSPYYIDWKVLCQKAQEIKIDSDFIYEMHLKFDINNLWFRMDS